MGKGKLGRKFTRSKHVRQLAQGERVEIIPRRQFIEQRCGLEQGNKKHDDWEWIVATVSPQGKPQVFVVCGKCQLDHWPLVSKTAQA